MKKNVDVLIGDRVKLFRIASGMKQKELADKLGISYQQVQKYESGKDKISISRLIDISAILGTSPMTFLEGVTSFNVEHNRQTLSMMKNFTKIESEKDRQAIADVVKIMSEKHKLQKS